MRNGKDLDNWPGESSKDSVFKGQKEKEVLGVFMGKDLSRFADAGLMNGLYVPFGLIIFQFQRHVKT